MELPAWVWIIAVVWLIIAIASFIFTWDKCGTRTLILGNGGFAAAATGMCN